MTTRSGLQKRVDTSAAARRLEEIGEVLGTFFAQIAKSNHIGFRGKITPEMEQLLLLANTEMQRRIEMILKQK